MKPKTWLAASILCASTAFGSGAYHTYTAPDVPEIVQEYAQTLRSLTRPDADRAARLQELIGNQEFQEQYKAYISARDEHARIPYEAVLLAGCVLGLVGFLRAAPD